MQQQHRYTGIVASIRPVAELSPAPAWRFG